MKKDEEEVKCIEGHSLAIHFTKPWTCITVVSPHKEEPKDTRHCCYACRDEEAEAGRGGEVQSPDGEVSPESALPRIRSPHPYSLCLKEPKGTPFTASTSFMSQDTFLSPHLLGSSPLFTSSTLD